MSLIGSSMFGTIASAGAVPAHTPAQTGPTQGNVTARAGAAQKPSGAVASQVQTQTAGRWEGERIARRLVQAGGTGDRADVALVVAELTKMPIAALRRLESSGVKVIACRGSVTDYATDLKGVRPRGWPPGATWDAVPGAHIGGRNAVVIAVIGHGKGTPHVAKTGEGHGSANLVIHEATHAIDAKLGATRNSSSAAFNKARNKDVAALPAYERQPGAAGKSEAYAESAARYYGSSHGKIKTPALDAYWRDNPLGGR